MKQYGVTLLDKNKEMISADFVKADDLPWVSKHWGSDKKVMFIEVSSFHSDGYSEMLKFERRENDVFIIVQKSRHYEVSGKQLLQLVEDREV